MLEIKGKISTAICYAKVIEYDKEAIVVRLEGLGDIGHVANSVHTVVGESISAGRLYD